MSLQRSWACGAALAVCLLASTVGPVRAQDLRVVDLAPLPGNTTSRAYDVNHAGLVVGVSGNATTPSAYEVKGHAVIWQGNVPLDLGVLPGHQFSVAYGINDAGWVVGGSGTDVVDGPRHGTLLGHAFLVRPADTNGDGKPDCWWRDDNADGVNDLMLDLGALLRPGQPPTADDYSMASGINNHGQVAAYSWKAGTVFYRACLWSVDDGWIDLNVGPRPGVTTGYAFGINDSGQVVGMYAESGYSRGFVWTPSLPNGPTGSWLELGTLGGAAGDAFAVNTSGLIVGVARDASQTTIACTWSGQSEPTALSTRSCAANDVSSSGVIVGTWLWVPGQAPVLMDYVASGAYLVWNSMYAQAISESGLIVGYGTVKATGLIQAFLIGPTNHAPIAAAGADQTVECTGTLTAVVLDGSGSSDPDGDALSYTWKGPFGTATGVQPTVELALGVHAISLTVTDGKGGTATDTVSITVRDTTPPILSVPADVIVYQDCAAGATVTFAVTATDNSGSASVSVDRPSGSVFPLGVTTVTGTATDAAGNTATGSFVVTVVVPPSSTSNKVTGGGRISVPGGDASFGMVEITNADGEVKGSLTFTDHVTGKTYKSLQITGLVVSGNHGRIFGKASVDGAGSVDFVADVDDLADPGANVDRFAIQFSDGFSAAGTVLDNGNVSVH